MAEKYKPKTDELAELSYDPENTRETEYGLVSTEKFRQEKGY